ncbi:hypothetical protein VSR34_22295 [Paraburkholderia sp. JHI2823]|uniref:hypothetical protein n=1 Tax=Paraburkholderia sp. JHI2823 TaxID=3112960 RepID=UPI003171A32E
MAADPFVEKPPLMYWSGALAARLASGVLPIFPGAQIAVLAWMLLACACVGRLAQEMHGKVSFDWLAPMLMLGSLGAIEPVHKLTADVPQLAGAALALAALARLARVENRVRLLGLLLGTGAGIAFLSKGLLVVGVLSLTCLAALMLPAYRTRRYAAALACAVLAALPWVVIWPALLWHTSHPLFIEWLWNNNFGRFFGFAHLGGERKARLEDLAGLIVVTFPAGWLAVAALIATLRAEGWRRYGSGHPEFALLWCYVLLFVATLLISSVYRDVYALPILPALAVLGAGVLLPSRIGKTCGTLAIVLMSTLGVFLWVRWGLQLTGYGRVAAGPIGTWLPLDYQLAFSPWLVLVALLLSALWIAAIALRRELGALTLGFAGLTFVWGTLTTLLLPWINEARSYRTPFAELREALPRPTPGRAPYSCVGSYGVGDF